MNPNGLLYSPPNGQIPPSTSDLILSVVALAVLAPVLIFIATATRLSAARREQRFAAMRLVGATRKQVSVLAAVESTVAALLGVALGFGLFFLLRAAVAGISFIGEPFFPAELTLSPADILLVAIGVPAAAAVAARLALRRVRISPLGVARRTTPKPPRAWRVLPLLAGFADLGYFVINGKPVSPATQVKAFVPGYLLIIVGLVIAGPWLTMVAARVMARLANRPATLIAARRLADDPRAAFRAVSGLVLALLITTAAVVAIATQNTVNQTRFGTGTVVNMLTSQLADQQPDGSGETVHVQTANGQPVGDRPGRPRPGRGRPRRSRRSPRGCGRSPASRAWSSSGRTRGCPFPAHSRASARAGTAPPPRSRPARSPARSSRRCPRSAAARPGRWRRRSQNRGSTARCSASGTSAASSGRP